MSEVPVHVLYVDPRARVIVEIPEPYTLKLDHDAAAPVIGVLANGFPDSERFASHVATALQRAWPGAGIREYSKRDASSTAPDHVIAGIVAECDAAVTLYGH